jgi:hypothetical protein
MRSEVGMRVESSASAVLVIAGNRSRFRRSAAAGARPGRRCRRRPASERQGLVRGGLRQLPRARRPRHAAEPLGFEIEVPDFTDCSFATPEPDSTGRRSSCTAARPARSTGGCRPSRGALTDDQTSGHPRLRPHDVHRPGVASRRAEPAAPAPHREGVSRERGGAHDHVQYERARTASATSFSTSGGSARGCSGS